MEHPAVGMISVTGDTDTGKRIARITADSVKRLHLELGGMAPVIVLDDADIEAAAASIRSASVPVCIAQRLAGAESAATR